MSQQLFHITTFTGLYPGILSKRYLGFTEDLQTCILLMTRFIKLVFLLIIWF
jgi:hypothetical protein